MAAPATSAKYVAYKPTTTFRVVLRPEEMVRHPVCSTWFEELVVPHFAFGTHCTIPGRPADGASPQTASYQKGKETITVTAKNNRYGFALCPPGIEREDLGQVHTLALLAISARRTALDVIGLSLDGRDEVPELDGTYKLLTPAVQTSELFQKGFFVPDALEPRDDEIDAAETRRQNYLVGLVEKADRMWNNSGGKSDGIHPDAIKAARWLDQVRPWAPAWSSAKKEAPPSLPCPVCMEPVVKGQRKCFKCLEILGYDEAGTLFWYNDPERKNRIVAEKLAANGG
jgi:hypothetical protein